MSKGRETYGKKEIQSKKEKKRKEKEQRRQARKDNEKNSFDDMIAYVDENGRITDTPPDPTHKKEVKAENIRVSVPKDDEVDEEDNMRRGKVTYFNDSKGFGFIRDLESRDDIFVHINNAFDDIKEGNIVNFEIKPGPKGLTAVNVTPEA